MSGEAKKRNYKGKGKGKKNLLEGNAGDNGHVNGIAPGKREKVQEGGAGILTKLIFGVLLVTCSLVATLYLVDYKQGQLAAAIPPEVIAVLDKTKANLNQGVDTIVLKFKEICFKIPIGDKMLDMFFLDLLKMIRKLLS